MSPPRVRTDHGRGGTGPQIGCVTGWSRHLNPWTSTARAADDVAAADDAAACPEATRAGSCSAADRGSRDAASVGGGVTGVTAGSADAASNDAATCNSRAVPPPTRSRIQTGRPVAQSGVDAGTATDMPSDPILGVIRGPLGKLEVGGGWAGKATGDPVRWGGVRLVRKQGRGGRIGCPGTSQQQSFPGICAESLKPGNDCGRLAAIDLGSRDPSHDTSCHSVHHPAPQQPRACKRGPRVLGIGVYRRPHRQPRVAAHRQRSG